MEKVVEKLRRGTSRGIAVALVGEVGPNDLDGNRWRFVASDGNRVTMIDADLSGSNGGHRGMAIDVDALEATVEHAAGSFPVESRLADLEVASPIVLGGIRG